MSLTDFNVSLTALLLRQHNPCILFNYEAPVWVSIHLVLDFSVNNWHFFRRSDHEVACFCGDALVPEGVLVVWAGRGLFYGTYLPLGTL